MMVNMTWQWIVTTSIAAYAAFLSTYNAIAAKKKEEHSILVEVTYGFRTMGPDLGDQMVMIGAANHGHRSVTLKSAGFLLPDRRQLFFMGDGDPRLPHHLSEGTSCTQWSPIHVIQAELMRSGFSGKVTLKGFYLDALNNRHLSKPIQFVVS
jgi:hypothetical protein